MTTCCDKHISGEQNGRIGITMIASVKILYYFHSVQTLRACFQTETDKNIICLYIYIYSIDLEVMFLDPKGKFRL